LAILWAIFVQTGFTDQTDSDHWYEYSIGGVPCGYLQRTVSLNDPVCTTLTTECLHIKRNGVSVRMETRRLFEETIGGVPLESAFTQINGGTQRTSSIVFSEEGMLLTRSRARGGSLETERPDPGDWLTPRGVSSLVRARIASGAMVIEYQVLRTSGSPGAIQRIRMERLPEAAPRKDSDDSEVSCWRVEREGESLELLEWRDAQGLLLESRMDTGLGPLRSLLTTRSRALRALEDPSPELMNTTVVEVSSMPRRSDRIVTAGYLVRIERPLESLESLPMSAGAQRVRKIEDQLFEFEIDASRGSLATSEELDQIDFIASSPAVDSDDPEISAFTRRVLTEAPTDSLQRAELLRRAVDRHIHHKSLSSGLDTASEVLRSRSGDCTEHAMLLAATLRADGIPSRVAIGLVHTEVGAEDGSAFVWHMWTQGLINGQWYDFDPTRRLRFDGGHVLIALDSLAEGSGGQQMAALLGLVGRLRISAFMVDGVAVGNERNSP
jgi:hypothetical protein